MSAPLSSPLAGIRVVEFEGIGPGPLAARMLADMGAEVTVIARPQQGAVAA
ncbi:MAG: CoA transferase, partial [Giesbergeria sp.]